MDVIYRQDAIDVADAIWSVTGDKNVAKVWDQIKDLPSAQPVAKDINVITNPDLQQPCNDLATDSISIEKLLTFYERQAKELKGVYGDLGGACSGVAKSIKLLTAQPERKIGHWIEADDSDNRISGRCSVCGWESHLYEDDVVGMDFCPNCGADMKGDRNE